MEAPPEQPHDSREVFRVLPFPFADGRFPPQLGAVVQTTVLRGEEPARLVVHTADGSWLVGDGRNDPDGPGAAVVTHMAHVVERNSSVASLATLPPGTAASRSGPGEGWTTEPHRWADDEPS